MPLSSLPNKMNFDYQLVVNKDGEPQSVLIDWEQFQAICQKLESGLDESTPASEYVETPVSEAAQEGTEEPVSYKSGGDYQPLSDIGIGLPSNPKRRFIASDAPVLQETEEVEHEIKIGKRIR